MLQEYRKKSVNHGYVNIGSEPSVSHTLEKKEQEVVRNEQDVGDDMLGEQTEEKPVTTPQASI